MTELQTQLANEWYAVNPGAENYCFKCRKRYSINQALGPSVLCSTCGEAMPEKEIQSLLTIIARRRAKELAEKQASAPIVETEDDAPRCDPPGLSDVIGNSAAVQQIRTALDAHHVRLSRGIKTVFPHTLLVGPAGSGKTTLSGIVARECKTKFHEFMGQSLNDPKSMVAALLDLKEGDILFLDEIHGLRKNVTETLYKALEERQVMPIAMRGAAPPKPIRLPRFTLIGATTDQYQLTESFKQRFQYKIELKRMTVEEIASAISQRANKIGVTLDGDGAKMIADRSHGTPRKAVMLLNRCIDTALAGDSDLVDSFVVERACEMAEIDSLGLTAAAQTYLRTIETSGKAVRLNVLSSTLGLPSRVVEVEVERDLIYLGLIEKRDNGRVLTISGRAHLKH